MTEVRLVEDLDYADGLLCELQDLAEQLRGMDPVERMRLDLGLRVARRAVAAAQSPGRRDHAAAAVAPAIATTGGPVESLPLIRRNRPSPGLAVAVAPARGSAGGPPASGAGFDLPRSRGLPEFEVGTARLGALPAVNGSLARRAD